jgi:hypothetical protein
VEKVESHEMGSVFVSPQHQKEEDLIKNSVGTNCANVLEKEEPEIAADDEDRKPQRTRV